MSESQIKIKIPSWLDKSKPFIFGGISGALSTCMIQPIDMIKVRLQIHASTGNKSTFFNIFKHIIEKDGIRGLYRGLDAAISRQIVYTTTRLGIFRVSSDYFCEKLNVKSLPFSHKAIIGLYSGAIGAFVGNPADLSLIRLQSDAALPPNLRKNYSGVCNTIFRIIREEGFFSLYKGSTPTIIRAMALNAGMLSTYDQSKEIIGTYTDNKTLICCLSSCISGFFAVTCSLPFDYIKTCLQKGKSNKKTNNPDAYSGFIDCVVKNYRNGGIRLFYASYGTYYLRIAPHSMSTLLLVDFFQTIAKKYTIIKS